MRLSGGRMFQTEVTTNANVLRRACAHVYLRSRKEGSAGAGVGKDAVEGERSKLSWELVL